MSANIVIDSVTVKSVALDVIEEINREHRLAVTCARDAVQHAIRCGQLLLDAKDRLAHGEFGKWITTNCECGYSTAARYMKAAKQISTGVEIPSLSALFPSGRYTERWPRGTARGELPPAVPAKPESETTEDADDDHAEEDDGLHIHGLHIHALREHAVATQIAPAPESPRIDVGSGRKRRNLDASTITTSLIDNIDAHVATYQSLADEFEAVRRLTGFPREFAMEYEPLLAAALKKLSRLHTRIAAIAKEAQ